MHTQKEQDEDLKKTSPRELLLSLVPEFIKNFARAIDKRVDGAISFFFKHFGKTKFMISMSKRVQTLGMGKLWKKSPKAFVYFFLFYLIRDTILYIIIPIYFAKATSGQ